MSVESIAIVGVIATVVAGFGGAALGSYFTYLSGIKLVQKTHANDVALTRVQEFNTAVASFHAAFAPALAFLYLAKKHRIPSDKGISPSDVDKFLRDAILNHAAAIEQFRPHISKSEGVAYQEAWEKYRYEACNYGFDTTCLRTDIDDPYIMFEDLIHNILQFAKEK